MSGGDSGRSSRILNSTGSVSLTFTGTGVTWISRLTESSGIARVSIDGVFVKNVDRYAPQAAYQQAVFTTSGLSMGQHTIELAWTNNRNPKATGANLLLDAFDIVPIVPQPTSVAVTPLVDGHAVSWAWTSDVAVSGFRLVRTNSSDGSRVIHTTGAATRLYRDTTAEVGATYTYRVEPVPASTSASSVAASKSVSTANTRLITDEIVRTQQCPQATTTVSTAPELVTALAAAQAGTVIWLNPGTYVGQFKLRNIGGGDNGIWICGNRDAVVTTGSTSVGTALMLNNVSNVTVRGITLSNSLKGVAVIAGTAVSLRDLGIFDIGYESVHFRIQSTDSFLIGSEISRAGLVGPQYGEGVYLGTSSANTCDQNNCQPDATARIHVVDNVISETAAQPIEAKEGTWDGSIFSNRLTGADNMDPASTGLVLLKGNEWTAVNNSVTVKSGYGLATIFTKDGSGNDNVFAGNAVTGNASYAVWVHKPTFATSGPVVKCSNSENGPGEVSNVTCQP